jgi:hypothetical protein
VTRHPTDRSIVELDRVRLDPRDGGALRPIRSGRSWHVARLGRLYDSTTGDLVIDLTDELLADAVATTAALGYSVPIDLEHGLMRSSTVDGRRTYGQVVELEHVPGVGLMGTPMLTPDGEALVASQGGALWLSPVIRRGDVYHPQTGLRVGGASIDSVSLTATPYQDGMSAVSLARESVAAPLQEVNLVDEKKNGEGSPDVVTLSRIVHEAQVTELARARADVSLAQADAARLSGERDAAVTALARVSEAHAAEAKEAATVKAVDLLVSAGKVAPGQRAAVVELARLHGVEGIVAALSLVPGVALVPSGRDGVDAPPAPRTRSDLAARIVELSRDGKMNTLDAALVAGRENLGGVA